MLTIYGTGFGTEASKVNTEIAEALCSVHACTDRTIQCVAAPHGAGIFNLTVHVKGKGYERYGASFSTSLEFRYDISLTSISPSYSGYGGGRTVSIKGRGFQLLALVRFCENISVVKNATLTEIICIHRPQSTMDVTNLHIVACQDRKEFCSILLPWLIHECRSLTVGTCNVI